MRATQARRRLPDNAGTFRMHCHAIGEISARGLTEGASARAVVRAEAISLWRGATARIVDRRPHGAHDLVVIEAQGVSWRALIHERGDLGDTVDVTFQPAGVFAFYTRGSEDSVPSVSSCGVWSSSACAAACASPARSR